MLLTIVGHMSGNLNGIPTWAGIQLSVYFQPWRPPESSSSFVSRGNTFTWVTKGIRGCFHGSIHNAAQAVHWMEVSLVISSGDSPGRDGDSPKGVGDSPGRMEILQSGLEIPQAGMEILHVKWEIPQKVMQWHDKIRWRMWSGVGSTGTAQT
ncbi:hypothetical protein EDD17DRAFT_1514324 [Pisolithus thermaeus]|nr:hypothetical protein EDD17DRAFT_1514324 [Pisolithus thermaeus]